MGLYYRDLKETSNFKGTYPLISQSWFLRTFYLITYGNLFFRIKALLETLSKAEEFSSILSVNDKTAKQLEKV